MRDRRWQLLECVPAWEGNWTWDCFLVFAWQGPEGERLLAAVNYAPNRSQCHVRLPFTDLGGRLWRLEDQMDAAVYDREGYNLQSSGLYLDMAPWQASVFTLMPGLTLRKETLDIPDSGRVGAEPNKEH